MYNNSSSSRKSSKVNVVTVVITPMNKFAQERVTKAEEGMEKRKLVGYIRGMEEKLEMI